MVGATSELLSDNAQFDALTSDLSSRTAVFDCAAGAEGTRNYVVQLTK